jgi:cytochrome c oxidase subunit 2
MQSGFPLFPESASTISGSVDALYFFLVGVSGTMSILIFICIFYFAVRYRERPEHRTAATIEGNLRLEIAWTVFPLAVAMIMFTWGAAVFIGNSRVPDGALEIYVVGKQWMWKIQHPDGRREINELHVPTGQPVRLIMASEDVIHSFYIPAFRVKQDVLPGRYSSMWFEATKPGRYHLFCAEYCGTQHSGMVGAIVVLEPRDYEQWLAGASGQAGPDDGARLFEQYNCRDCHLRDGNPRGPALAGAFGKQVQLQDGRTVTFDEAYFRESVLNPNAKVVAGYMPIMPTFQGQIGEEQLLRLLSYVKSLSAANQEETR